MSARLQLVAGISKLTVFATWVKGKLWSMATKTRSIRTVLNEQQKADAAVRVLSGLLSNPEVLQLTTMKPRLTLLEKSAGAYSFRGTRCEI